LGGPFGASALFKTRDGTHIYLLAGRTSQYGFLIRAREEKEDDGWCSQEAFICRPRDEPAVLIATLTNHSWDPWLVAENSGDTSLVDGPVKRRRKVTDEQNLARGTDRDRLTISCEAVNRAPDVVLGVTVRELDQLLDGYRAALSEIEDTLTAWVVDDSEGRGMSDPKCYRVYLVNESNMLMAGLMLEMGAWATMDDETGETMTMPGPRRRHFIPPGAAVEIDSMTAYAIDFVTSYTIEFSRPLGDARQISFSFKYTWGFRDERYVPALKRKAYKQELYDPNVDWREATPKGSPMGAE
jgi:hypothetical protein